MNVSIFDPKQQTEIEVVNKGLPKFGDKRDKITGLIKPPNEDLEKNKLERKLIRKAVRAIKQDKVQEINKSRKEVKDANTKVSKQTKEEKR